jgi:hypothetical protein
MTEQVWEFRTGCHNVIDDNTPMRLPGDNRTFTAKELRTLGYEEHELLVLAVTPLADSQLGAWQLTELKRHYPGFMSVLSFDGTSGTVETREDGKTVKRAFSFANGTITPSFAPNITAGGPRKDKEVTGAFAPLPTYEKALAERRAAEQTPESNFEERYRAERLAEFASEPARVAALRAAHGLPEPQLRHAAGAPRYPIPDSYGPDLQRLRERDARQLAAKEAK